MGPGTQCRACGALLTDQRYPEAVEFSASYHGYVEPGVSRRHHHWQVPYALRRRFYLGSALTPTHLTPHFYRTIRIVLGHRPSLCNRKGNVVRVGGMSVRGPWRPCPSWTKRATLRTWKERGDRFSIECYSPYPRPSINPSENRLGRYLGSGGSSHV